MYVQTVCATKSLASKVWIAAGMEAVVRSGRVPSSNRYSSRQRRPKSSDHAMADMRYIVSVAVTKICLARASPKPRPLQDMLESIPGKRSVAEE